MVTPFLGPGERPWREPENPGLVILSAWTLSWPHEILKTTPGILAAAAAAHAGEVELEPKLRKRIRTATASSCSLQSEGVSVGRDDHGQRTEAATLETRGPP